MRLRAAIVLAIGMAIQFTPGTMFAHHSFSGEFDNSIAVTLQGGVASVQMVNPHSFIYLDGRCGAISDSEVPASPPSRVTPPLVG